MPLRTRGANSVLYFELVDGHAEQVERADRRVTRLCRVRLQDLGAFWQDMLGQSSQVHAGHPIVRTMPDWYYLAGSSEPLYATGYEFVMGFDPHNALVGSRGQRTQMAFQQYLYRVHYANLPYAVLPNGDPRYENGTVKELTRHIERVATQATEAIQVPGGQYKFVGTNVPINEPAPKALPTSELTYTWHAVPATAVPVAAITACRGHVNAATFDSDADLNRWPFRAFPAGTLLLTTVDYKSYIDWWGRPMADIQFKFAERNNGDAAEGGGVKAGWNHLYRHSTGTWVKVTHNGAADGRTIYETADYNGLFTAN